MAPGTVLVVAVLLTAGAHGRPQNPFAGFNLRGLFDFAVKETAKVVGEAEAEGRVQVINPVSAFSAALGRGESNQDISIGTPFGEVKIGGGGGGQPQPTPSATTPPSPAPTTPPTPAPCEGSGCQPEATGEGATSREEIFPGCGVNLRSIGTRIVGGTVADPDQWPWMAALLRGTPGFFCGGALISEQHVLTAAHCVARLRPREVRVRLGVYDFTNDTESAGAPVSRILIHPQYDSALYRYDAAILTLQRPATLGDSVWPICLPQGRINYTDKKATVAGWGTIYSGGPVSRVLRQLTIPVWRQQDCDAAYPQTIGEMFLCAGGRRGNQDACQGDSGGPLQFFGEDDAWSVIGIVSWGKKCAEPGFPGVYTRVTEVMRWIRRSIL